jgi:nifR3 family TIM-barrel protein
MILSKETRKFLNTPLNTGNKTIKNRLILAPMAGINHIGFRKLINSFGGCGLLFTGMLNARALPTENRFKSNVFRFDDNELSNLGAQIFGNDPFFMAEAAKRIEDEGFFCIDLNFGCSVKSICNKNYCAALLKNPDLAVKIVEQVRKKVSFPLFIKMRTGWSEDIDNAVKLAKRFENAGADALTFHPRTAPDKRTRPPKHEYTGIIKENLNIPVFANGNIFTPDDAEKVLNNTKSDGIALGRITVAKPWIFSSWTQGENFDYDVYEQTLKQALKEYSFLYGEKLGIKLFKKFYKYFCANFKFGNQFSGVFEKKDLSYSDVLNSINKIFEKHPEIAQTPNLNLFAR